MTLGNQPERARVTSASALRSVPSAIAIRTSRRSASSIAGFKPILGTAARSGAASTAAGVAAAAVEAVAGTGVGSVGSAYALKIGAAAIKPDSASKAILHMGRQCILLAPRFLVARNSNVYPGTFT